MQPPDAFWASLRRWGALRTPRVERALAGLDWDRLLPHAPGRAAGLYAPTPTRAGSFDLSPRASILLVELLEVEVGTRVALPAPRPRIVVELVRELGGTVHDAARGEVADRALQVAPVPRRVTLADGGFALRVSFEPNAEALTKRIHTREGDAELGLHRMPLRTDLPERPIRHLLVVEGFCRRFLAGRPRTRQDEMFREAVDTTWDPAALHAAGADRGRLEAARAWFGLAYLHQFSADLGDAIELYRASLEAHPTAEAHTFLGWTHSFLGDLTEAITECEAAIEVDASFGNPYNDIGAYLLELGRPDEALPWLERALAAPRYDAPHFAHCNRGRALLGLGRAGEARRAFESALRAEPGYRPAREFLRRMGA